MTSRGWERGGGGGGILLIDNLKLNGRFNISADIETFIFKLTYFDYIFHWLFYFICIMSPLSVLGSK